MKPKKETKNNFDHVAWCYDFLARLIFGNKIRQSQILLFDHIREGDHVLIIGGGTGWIISELLKVKKVGSIDYIEASSQMLKKAKSNAPEQSDVVINFILGDENSIVEQETYDVVLACYFFDVFQSERVNDIITKVVAALKSKGKLLVADFFLSPSSPITHKVLVKIMYLFFYLTCDLEVKRLTNFRTLFKNHSLVQEYSFSSSNGLILSEVYKKVI